MKLKNSLILILGILLCLVLTGLVSATASITYNVYNATIDNSNTQINGTTRISGFYVVGFVCSSSDCSTVSSTFISETYVSGSSYTVNYPTTLQSPYGYAVYMYKDGYIEWEISATYAGSGSLTKNAYLSKKQNGQAIISNFRVNNSLNSSSLIQTNVNTNISAQLSSALVNSGPLNYDPTQLSNYKKVNTSVTLEIRNSTTGSLIYSDSKYYSIPYSSFQDVLWNYNFTNAGSYNVTLYTDIYDAKIMNSNRQSISSIIIVNSNSNGNNVVPIINLISPSSLSTYNNSTIWLNLSCNQTITTWVYSLNGAANVTFVPNRTISAQEGSNYIIVYGTNLNGTSSASTWFTVNSTVIPVDTTGPIFTNLVNLSILDNQTLAYDIDATDPAGIDNFRINDSRFSINQTGFLSNATISLPGIYWLNVSVNDTLGNTNFGIFYVNVTNHTLAFDTTGPIFTNLVNLSILDNQTLAYNIDATDPAGIDNFRINDSRFSINQTGFLSNATILLPGIYWLNVSVNDTLGNINSGVFYVNVTNSTNGNLVDTTLPIVIIQSPNRTLYNYTLIPIIINASDNVAISRIWFNINGSVNYSYNNIPINLAFADNQTYVINAFANDTSGNVGNASFTFAVNTSSGPMDLIPPFITFISPQNITYNNISSILVNISASNDSVNIWWNNGTHNITYVPGLNYTFSNGSHTLYAYANDSSGNLNLTSVTFYVNLTNGGSSTDITLPSLVIVSPNQSVYNVTNILVSLNATDNVAIDRVWYSFNGTNITYLSATSVNFIDNQTYTLFAYANDTSGNIVSRNFTFRVNTSIADVTAPVITNITTDPVLPFINNGTTQNITINFTSSEYPINITFNLYNGNLLVNTQGPYNLNNSSQLPVTYVIPSNLINGTTYVLNMTVNDSYGNSNTYTIGNFTVIIPSVIIINNGGTDDPDSGNGGTSTGIIYVKPANNITSGPSKDTNYTETIDLSKKKVNPTSILENIIGWLLFAILIIFVIILGVAIVKFAIAK